MLQSMKDDVEIVIAINANDIERSKVRGDLGITYDEDVLRLMDIFRSMGFKVGSVVITRYANQPDADLFRKRLDGHGHHELPALPHSGLSQRHRPHRLRRGLRQKRVHRDRAPASSW